MPRIRTCLVAATLMAGLTLSAGIVDSLIRFDQVSRALDTLCSLASGAACLICDGANAAAEKLRGIELPKLKTGTAPELKRHTNFFMIENMSNGAWKLRVADLETNYKGQGESGKVRVYRELKEGGGARLILMATLGPGEGPVCLDPGIQYLIYPELAGKVLGSKLFASDFARTLYLEDSRGARVALAVTRAKDSGAKVQFGYTQNSWPADPKWAPVVLNPDYDDIAAIATDTLLDPPRKPN